MSEIERVLLSRCLELGHQAQMSQSLCLCHPGPPSSGGRKGGTEGRGEPRVGEGKRWAGLEGGGGMGWSEVEGWRGDSRAQ